MKRVVILIDGQNLYYAIKNLKLIERNLQWASLFNALLEPNDELIRTYWFRPQRIYDGNLTNEMIKNQIIFKEFNGCYSKHKSGEYQAIDQAIRDKIEVRVKEINEWSSKQKQLFSNIEYSYDQLCLDNSDIEMVKRGIVKVNPFKQEYIGEKGVDISLAVKMIALSVERKCDKVILVSGDYDYAEAINYVKNNMTKVHIVKLHKGFPPKNKNTSRDLSVLADKVIDLYEEDIRNRFLKQ